MNSLLQIILLSMLPIAELRGGIPLAIAYNYNPINAFLICTLANILIIPIIFLFLETINKIFLKISWYNKVFYKYLEKARKKVHNSVEKYGYIGLMIFVAIPLPITGAYTGAIGAWALGLEKKRAFAFIALGVIIAGIIVTLVSYYGFHFLDIFIAKT